MAIIHHALGEHRNRTSRLSYMTGELSDDLVTLHWEVAAPNPLHTNPIAVIAARDSLEAPCMGACDSLQNIGAVPVA